VVALLAGVALLHGCGDGGNGSGGSGSPIAGSPTPSPSPSPSPTPSPTPTPTYTAYANLTGDQHFKTACAGLQSNGSLPTALPATEFGNGATLDYAAATQTYTVSANGATDTFGPADIDTSAPAGVGAYKKVLPTGTDRLSFSGSPLSGITFDYTRFFQWTTTQALGNRPVQMFCVFGVPTLVNDVPPVTSVTFPSVKMIGTAYTGTGPGGLYSLQHSVATFSVNLVTGKVDAALTLIGTPSSGGGADITIATIEGIGDIDPTTGGFYGQWTTASRGIVGNFGGRFFGPQGKEFAFTTSMIGNTGGVQDLSIYGIVLGAR
jgi:hypothetical protein